MGEKILVLDAGTTSTRAMLFAAVCIAVSASLIGVWASFFLDSAPAPTIVLLMTIIFIIAFVWASVRARGAVGL